MPKKLLTKKQEDYARFLFEGCSNREAWVKAGYSQNMLPSTIDANASRLAASSKVIARIEELRKKAEDASVMNVLERKQRLTEIARAKLTDFMELGQDGSWVNIGKETPQGGAIQEIHSRTEYDENGSAPTVYTSVKLHDPTKAIDLLNKMDKIYTEGNQENNDKRSIQVNVININGGDVAAAIIELAKAGAADSLAGNNAQVVSVHPAQADSETTRLPAP